MYISEKCLRLHRNYKNNSSQDGFVSSHFFFRLLHVMQPVFDRPFCTLIATSKLSTGCLRGRPRGLLARGSVLVSFGVGVLIDDASCKSSICTSSSGISSFGSTKESESSNSSPLDRSIADSSSTNPEVLQGSVEADLTVSRVNVEDEEASERCRTSPSWRGMKEELEISQNSVFVTRLNDPTSDTGSSPNAAL
jgi:hypothetical protein